MMYTLDGNGEYCDIPQKTSPNTKIKHSNFETFLNVMFDHWFKNSSEPFWIIDLNAGAGVYPNGEKTMGLRFIDKYLDNRYDPMNLTGIMCESDLKSAFSLMGELNKRGVEHFEFLADNKLVRETPGNDQRGLILYDPNGLANFRLLNMILEQYPNMDVFMHLQPAFEARRFWSETFVPLVDKIKAIPRTCRLITDQYGRYMDCVGSNSVSGKMKRSVTFVAPESRKGLTIVRKVYYKWVGFCKSKTTPRFIKDAREVHGDRYTYDRTNYTGAFGKVTITCSIHGDFEQRALTHLRGCGCPKCARIQTGNRNRTTNAEFIEAARKVHGNTYTYENVQCQRLSLKVNITCPIHGEFQQSPISHLKGHGCPKCRSEKQSIDQRNSKEHFISLARQVHGDKFSYDKLVYIDRRNKGTITCPIHGDFQQTLNNHLVGNDCPKCAVKTRAEKKTLTQEEFIEKCKGVHGDLYDYSETVYNGIRDSITICCPVHGSFQQTANNHVNGRGCPKCALQKRTQKTSNTLESFIAKSKAKFGDKYSYEKTTYVNNKTKTCITCPIHGDFEQKPNNHLNGKGCPACAYKDAWEKRKNPEN